MNTLCTSQYQNIEIPEEMYHWKLLMIEGAKKHSPNNWLLPNGNKSGHKEMHDSMFHHLSLSFSGIRIDEESNLDHLLHLATRALMCYTRIKKGLNN